MKISLFFLPLFSFSVPIPSFIIPLTLPSPPPLQVADSSSHSVAVEVGPAVVKVSQGLHHTLSLALHAWRDTLDRCLSWRRSGETGEVGEVLDVATTRCTLIPNYYIICNDTNEDLIIGQVTSFV